MGKFLSMTLLVGMFACSHTDNKDKDLLEQRLTSYLRFANTLNADSMMNYYYPPVFDLIPKDSFATTNDIQAALKMVHEWKLDTVMLDKIYPAFQLDNGKYAKIDLLIKFMVNIQSHKDSLKKPDSIITHIISADMYPAPKATLFLILLKNEFGPENIEEDTLTGNVKIRNKRSMLAVKNNYAKEWSFISLTENDSILKKLFDQQLIDRLAQ